MGTFYIGQIILFAGNFAPMGWQLCEGQLLAISTNEALFAILGTTYGGDGINTFALPDLRGRVPVQQGQGPGRPNYVLGQIGGTPQTTLTSNQMPSHTHAATATATINATAKPADATSPKGAFLAGTAGTPVYAAAPDGTSKLSARATTTTVTIGVAGSNLPIETQAPYLAMNYCICTEGLFPSQN
jgi:microcystin-dependent protein